MTVAYLFSISFSSKLNGLPAKDQPPPPPSRKSSMSHGVILRSKSEKPFMIPISPYDPNVMLFHPLVSKIWARTKMAH